VVDGDYTTNLPLEDVTAAGVGRLRLRGEPLEPSTAARRGCCPHLYFWKSAKWVRGLR
jgi:DMSO/TMAO reductase YedYZ molybdopterin-dependent catalytic subunit